MNNTSKLPVPPARPRQPTVLGVGGGMDVGPDPRIAELEQEIAQREAQNGMLEAALKLANAAHKAAEDEVDAAHITHQKDLEKISELNGLLTELVQKTGDETAIRLRNRLKEKDARILELKRGVDSHNVIFNVFFSEQDRLANIGIQWTLMIAEVFRIDLSDPELLYQLIARVKEIHSDLDDAQIRMALSTRAPTTRPVRDSETSIDPLKTTVKTSRSPRPDETAPTTQPSRAAAHPITMPPVGPIPSTPPSADDGELDIDDPDNPGRKTWDMGELPPLTR